MSQGAAREHNTRQADAELRYLFIAAAQSPFGETHTQCGCECRPYPPCQPGGECRLEINAASLAWFASGASHWVWFYGLPDVGVGASGVATG